MGEHVRPEGWWNSSQSSPGAVCRAAALTQCNLIRNSLPRVGPQQCLNNSEKFQKLKLDGRAGWSCCVVVLGGRAGCW
eukprot:5781974-Pyramimonas_sp.AAC.1